jgi:hypothetical protein
MTVNRISKSICYKNKQKKCFIVALVGSGKSGKKIRDFFFGGKTWKVEKSWRTLKTFFAKQSVITSCSHPSCRTKNHTTVKIS